jgi:hypothetical protein
LLLLERYFPHDIVVVPTAPPPSSPPPAAAAVPATPPPASSVAVVAAASSSSSAAAVRLLGRALAEAGAARDVALLGGALLGALVVASAHGDDVVLYFLPHVLFVWEMAQLNDGWVGGCAWVL